MKDISVVVPFLNEEGNMQNLLQSFDDYMSKQTFTAELILVNDGSRDSSTLIIEAYTPQEFDLKLINFSRNFGSHAALRAGFSLAEGAYATMVYADLQDPLTLLAEMYNKAQEADIVWAVRISTKLSFGTRIFSQFYAWLMKKYVHKDFPSKGFDVFMLNRKVLAYLNDHKEAHSSIFLQVLLAGFKQKHIEYHKQERTVGKSKWTFSKKVKLMIDSFVAFSYAPIRLVSLTGVIFFLIGLFWSLYIIGRELIYGDLEPGWPMLISILMIGFGTTNILLGIIAEYLWRTLDASRKRPVYIIDEIKDLTPNEDIRPHTVQPAIRAT